jgi:hypothetical protein
MVLAACKQKTKVPEVVRAIKTITVSEEAFGQTLKLSGLFAAIFRNRPGVCLRI